MSDPAGVEARNEPVGGETGSAAFLKERLGFLTTMIW